VTSQRIVASSGRVTRIAVDAEGYVAVPDRPGLGVEISDRWQKVMTM
jgi:L-alanine-DL-glutamate epimerase-like enolase superfamily enzyme